MVVFGFAFSCRGTNANAEFLWGGGLDTAAYEAASFLDLTSAPPSSPAIRSAISCTRHPPTTWGEWLNRGRPFPRVEKPRKAVESHAGFLSKDRGFLCLWDTILSRVRMG